MTDTPDIVVRSGNPDDTEIAALVLALAVLARSAPAPVSPVAALPTTWTGRDRWSAPAGWASAEGRHLGQAA